MWPEFDAVISVGGDGLISEIINGICSRVVGKRDGGAVGAKTAEEEPWFPIPIGVIPGGSTNALDYSLNGRSSAVNAAINIALGWW